MIDLGSVTRKTIKPKNEEIFFSKRSLRTLKRCCRHIERTPVRFTNSNFCVWHFSLGGPQSSTLRRRPGRCTLGGFRRRRAGREVGGLACVLRGSLPAFPSPSPAQPPLPLPSPPGSPPTLPTHYARCPALLLSFPSLCIRVADGCFWTGRR